MTDNLNYEFIDGPETADAYDELPLWSAPFGLLLLRHVELKPNMTVLDIGSGTGFPLVELAERLGSSCKCFALDIWINANNRTRQKIKIYNVPNVEVLDGSAEEIPFEDESVDLIVSNLGANNFENREMVFKECHRVLKPGGKFILTTNLNGHWKEFYILFEETLYELRKDDLVKKVKEQQEHRGTIDTVSKMFSDSRFSITKTVEDKLEMRFLNGSSFLRHHFIKLGWLSSWKNMVPKEEQEKIFSLLEEKLNVYAHQKGELKLTVPIALIEGQKRAK